MVEYLRVFSHVGFFVALSVDMATGQLFRRQKGLARMDDVIANIEGNASENENRLETQIQARLGAPVRHIRVVCVEATELSSRNVCAPTTSSNSPNIC